MTSSSRHAAAPGLGLRTLLRRHLRDRAPLLLTGVMVAVLAGVEYLCAYGAALGRSEG